MLSSDKMKALRFYDKGDIRLDEVPEPTLQPGRAIVEVEWCGICGSDLHEYLAGKPQTIIVPCKIHTLMFYQRSNRDIPKARDSAPSNRGEPTDNDGP